MGRIREILSRLSRRPGPRFTKIEGPTGSTIVVDETTLAYTNSKAPQPSQASLDALFRQCERVRVLRGGVAYGRPMTADVLFETEQPAVIADLREAMRVNDAPGGHCMCFGNAAIELLSADGGRVATIGLHHGRAVRWDGWKDDASLVDGVRLLQWLEAHGVAYPLGEYRRGEGQARESEAARQKWLAATPSCLVPLSDEFEMLGLGGDGLETLLDPLANAYKDGTTIAWNLFWWLGHGSGPWSGYPVYEDVALRLLMTLDIADLVGALDPDRHPTEWHVEGAARFFATWEFRTKRAADFAKLSVPIRQLLVGHALRSLHQDNRERAEEAFR